MSLASAEGLEPALHPHTYYSTLFETKKRDEVFVIMSFATEFDARWRDIIEPCIRKDLALKPNRVDYNVSGESVVHDIMDGIAHARLVLADITSTKMTDRHGQSWPQRNGNVMWELGIAHVIRLPDEVIVVRSDRDPNIFDLTQFRAFSFDPQDALEARRIIASIAEDRLRAVELAATEHVRRSAISLDHEAWEVLSEAAAHGLPPPETRTMGQVMANMNRIPAIARLLEIGALAASFVAVTAESLPAMANTPSERMLLYKVTPFGVALMRYLADRVGMTKPGVVAALRQMDVAAGDNGDGT